MARNNLCTNKYANMLMMQAFFVQDRLHSLYFTLSHAAVQVGSILKTGSSG
ncbi:MAG: hypothetical protein AB1847_22980 [bacterium]